MASPLLHRPALRCWPGLRVWQRHRHVPIRVSTPLAKPTFGRVEANLQYCCDLVVIQHIVGGGCSFGDWGIGRSGLRGRGKGIVSWIFRFFACGVLPVAACWNEAASGVLVFEDGPRILCGYPCYLVLRLRVPPIGSLEVVFLVSTNCLNYEHFQSCYDVSSLISLRIILKSNPILSLILWKSNPK